MFLSINRFDSKKNLTLAVEAFAKYTQLQANCENDILVLAGGYDPRLNDNVQVVLELQKLVYFPFSFN